MAFGFKSEKAQYKKGQKNRENRKSDRSGRNYWRNKKELLVRKNNGFEINVYYYRIYQC